MPGAAPKPFSPPPAMGGFPPAPLKPAAATPPPSALPPAAAKFNSQMNQAEEAKSGLEDKIAELEKKLMEEREKVLLAQLRSREEEAVSAKVETSIKEIQDKLRREKKEQELEESRRKAEAKVLQMERRLAEEREAWVSTLKGQLNQRDQITEEMESHFATRLKDLEYRWAQEKAGLETAVRDRDAEIVRIRQEIALKGEHDKAFWEDRIKTISSDREKSEREMERVSAKYQQEKDQLLFERQNLRDSVSKLESALKFVEEQGRVEKAAVKRESEAALEIAKQKASAERDALEKQISSLTTQISHHSKELVEKGANIEALKNQVAHLQTQLMHAQAQLAEKDRAIQQLNAQIKDERNTAENLKREIDRRESTAQSYLREIDDLRRRASALQHDLDESKKIATDLERANQGRRYDITKVQDEYETRIKVLQNRLDWYDANVKREYEMARDKVQTEMETMEAQLKEAQALAEATSASKEQLSQLETERNALREELTDLRAEWKEVQQEMNAQLRAAEEKVKAEQKKVEEIIEGKLAVEQELRQRISQVQAQQDTMDKRQQETDRLSQALQIERDKVQGLFRQIEEYKKIMHSQGVDGVIKMRNDLAEKEQELEQLKQKLQSFKVASESLDEKENMYRDKERVLRQLVTDKEETIAEFKNRIHTLERQLSEFASERDGIEAEGKKKIERLVQLHQRETQDRLEAQKFELEKNYRQEIDAAKAAAAAVPGAAPLPDLGDIERQVRQRMESEFLEQMREKETSMDQKVKEINEEAKKETEKWRWENENLKEELRRSREARMQIEREAQELIQQAELHYKGEFEKRMVEIEADAKNGRGFFGAIGKILDTPIIDTTKKKDL
jgi:chromosome segregation ATPase